MMYNNERTRPIKRNERLALNLIILIKDKKQEYARFRYRDRVINLFT